MSRDLCFVSVINNLTQICNCLFTSVQYVSTFAAHTNHIDSKVCPKFYAFFLIISYGDSNVTSFFFYFSDCLFYMNQHFRMGNICQMSKCSGAIHWSYDKGINLVIFQNLFYILIRFSCFYLYQLPDLFSGSFRIFQRIIQTIPNGGTWEKSTNSFWGINAAGNCQICIFSVS